MASVAPIGSILFCEAFLEQKECAEGSGAVLADPRQLSRKRRPAGHIPIAFAPHVGDFVGEQRRIGRRQAGNRRLARAGNSGKQKSFPPANRAGGMNQEASLPRQDETVNDAQDAIDGVGTARLTDLTMAGFRIPARAEVAPLQQPFACFDLHLQFIVGWSGFRGLVQVDVELEVRTRRSPDETRVAILDQPPK